MSAAFSTSEQILLGSRDNGIKTSGALESKTESHASHPFVCKSFESAKSFTQDCRQTLVTFYKMTQLQFCFLYKVHSCLGGEGNRENGIFVWC